MLSIAICDDEAVFLEQLERELRRLLGDEQYQISAYASGAALLAGLAQQVVDIVLLDIELPDVAGLELAQRLTQQHPTCQLIFVSGYLHYATEVYGVPHTWFVLKSQLQQKLPAALAQARLNLARQRQHSLSLEYHNTVQVVDQADILYLERQGRVTNVCCRSGRYTTHEPLDRLAPRLTSDFCRCHNSYFINMSAVVRYQRTAFHLSDGHNIPISRSYWDKARESFFRFAQLRLKED